jgi:diguanylate cyclase (GGDEF)-like protein
VANERPATDAQLDALADAAAALARATDIDGAVGAILESAVNALGATAGAVFLRHPDRADLHLGPRVGLDETEADAFEAEVSDPNHPVAAAARDVAAVFGRATVGAPVAGIAADVPLVVTHDGADLALGVLTFAWPADRTLDRRDEQVARATADLVAAAVDRAHLASLLAERTEWYERMAHTDPLTGLANRRTFEQVLDLELARAGRQGADVSLVLFDVDGFQELNTANGHEVGDDILRRVATLLAERVRLVDTVARHGPDEFIVIAPGGGGAIVAQRLLDSVGSVMPAGGPEVTLSAGVAVYPAEGATTADLITATEAALGPGSLSAVAVDAG